MAYAISAFLVRVARLELAASWSQTRRPTNWATPGNSKQALPVYQERIIHQSFEKSNHIFWEFYRFFQTDFEDYLSFCRNRMVRYPQRV